MRLNRKWLHLGGLVTILTLLLTLTLVLPAGAVGQLDPGSLSTESGYVSPDVDLDAKDRTVTVTLTNSDLDGIHTVGRGSDPDYDAVTFTVPTSGINATEVSSITVNIRTLMGTQGISAENRTDLQFILPVADNLAIKFDKNDTESSGSVDRNEVGSPVVRNQADGIIDIPVRATIEAGETITLTYDTSPQETALLNVSGDSGNFDLLAVESPSGPSGDYSAAVVAAEDVVIHMSSDIEHEQHPVPSGLRGYVEVDDEEITEFYSDEAATQEIDVDQEAGATFYVRVAKPPIRNESDRDDVRSDSGFATVAAQPTVSAATEGIVQMTVANGRELRLTDTLELDYFGSDSFSIEVDHGPIQNMGAVEIIVPTTDTDDSSTSMNKLQIISIDPGVSCADCRVRVGVMTGPIDDRDPAPLDPRISVLGISYEGSERVNVPSGLETDEIWPATLDFDPVDANNDGEVDGDDITVVSSSSDVRVALPHDDDDGDPVDIIDGDSVLLQFTGTGTTSENATVDVAYARRIGANPRNALLPGEEDRPIILVGAGSRVAFTSDNDRATVDAEINGPVFANPDPVHMGATDNDAQVISIDVTDELAGVDKDSVEFRVEVGGGAPLEVLNDDLSFSEIGGGYRASIALDDIEEVPNIQASDTTPVQWYAMAMDNAGNSGMSDADADNENEDGMAIHDDYMFDVDGEDPEIMRVYTGDWFDTVSDEVKGDRRLGVVDGEVAHLPGVSDNTSLRVVFGERVDGTTISADDFSVDGAAPTDAQWYGEGDTGSGDDTLIGQSVFLTVPAMAADSAPTLSIVGSVSDLAGNSVGSGSRVADDGIAPTATLSVDKALSDQRVTVTVQTDERIRTLSPDLALYISNGPEALDESDTFAVGNEDPDDPESAFVLRDADGNAIHSSGEIEAGDELILRLSKAPILDSNGDGKVNHDDVEVSTGLVTEVTTDGVDKKTGEVKVTVGTADLTKGNVITIKYSGTDSDPARGVQGVPNPSGKQESSTSWTFALSVTRNDRYAATASAEDSSRNRRTSGIADPMAADATVFEIDNRLAGGESAETIPQHDAAGNLAVSISNPFYIELSWDGENDEYPGDSSSAVTLTKAELDGEDVLDTAASQNDRSYRLSVLDIGLGDHVLSYNAEDALGNTNAVDRVLRFTVQAVPTWDLELDAGMNLISLPADPASTNVNDVFGAIEEIELIFTFEGAQSKVALRNPDNPSEFVGTLDSIDSQHAYWVSSSNAAKVEINIPPTSQLAPPPYIAVSGGQWNLLPVISLEPVDKGAAPDTDIDADAYLGDFRTAFGWNGRSWAKIDPDPSTKIDRLTDGASVKIGMGYWVLYDEDAILTP